MSFDRPRHATTPVDQPAQTSQRRTFLDVLRLELGKKYGFSSGVVLRERRVVLFVIGLPPDSGSVEIGCDMTEDGWYYTWAADDDRTIAPVEDTTGTADVIAKALGASAENGRCVRRP